MKQNISTIQSRAADKAVGSYHRQGLSIWLIFLCNVIFVGDVVHHVTKYKKSVNSNIIQRKNVYGFIRCQPLRTDLFVSARRIILLTRVILKHVASRILVKKGEAKTLAPLSTFYSSPIFV